MKVVVDKRVELLNMIQQISECKNKKKYPKMFEGAKKYIEKLYFDFGKFAENEIMKLYSAFDVNLTTAQWIAQDLDDKYNFTKFENISGSENFVRFLNLLPKFAQEIKFDKWFESKREFYDKITAEYSEFLDRGKFEEFMKWFYKADYDDSIQRSFCLMPTLYRCNMCIRNQNAIICHVSVAESEPVRFVDADKFIEGNAHTAIHEFSHWPMINIMVDKYFKGKELFSIDTARTQEVGVYHGQSVIVDTIIESVVQIYMRKKWFIKSADKRLQEWEESGFVYIKPVYEFIQNYVNNIGHYNSFSEYFPKVMEFLQEAQRERV